MWKACLAPYSEGLRAPRCGKLLFHVEHLRCRKPIKNRLNTIRPTNRRPAENVPRGTLLPTTKPRHLDRRRGPPASVLLLVGVQGGAFAAAVERPLYSNCSTWNISCGLSATARSWKTLKKTAPNTVMVEGAVLLQFEQGFKCPNRLNASIKKKTSRVRPTASVSTRQLSQAILFPKGRRTLAREPKVSRVAA